MYLLNLLASLKQIRRGIRNKPTVVNVKKIILYDVDRKTLLRLAIKMINSDSEPFIECNVLSAVTNV